MPSARQEFRNVLTNREPVILPVVYDAISARLTKHAGFSVALISGNVSAAASFGFPDIGLVSMAEMAALVRQFSRAAPLSYLVDGENGFGNALNTQRTVIEFEEAGASALMIEDTEMPQRYGTKSKSVISSEEMCGKLRAAVSAKRDKEFVIVGRTDALASHGLIETVKRVREISATGVDAIFVPAAKTREEFKALREATQLPILAVGLPADDRSSGLAFLKECGVSMTVTSTYPFQVSVQSVYESLVHLKTKGDFGELTQRACSRPFLDTILDAKKFDEAQNQFMS
jgi:2-methylisocitrate lyase-like PEP mutase family enzyme